MLPNKHRRLANTNALDLVFHIWTDPSDGIIGEINGFRLGLFLLDVLMQRVNVKQDNFKLVTMGSHSYIKYKRTTGEEVKYPLFASGSWKPFGNNNMDSGIMAYLQCYEVLRTALQKQNPRFEVPHRINKDCIAHGTMEYSVKMLLNKEERWTKAMKLLLTNLRTTMNTCNYRSIYGCLDREGLDDGEAGNSSSDSCGTRRMNVVPSVTSLLTKHFNKEQEMLFPSFWTLALASSLILAPVSIKNYDVHLNMYEHPTDWEAAYLFKMRPTGVRWRDEATLARVAYNYTQRMEMRGVTIMPIMTERLHTHPVHISGQLLPTTSTSLSPQAHDDPSLEDIELIDVLWRSDIAAEKGTRNVEPAEQYERDLQLLTEKSLYSPLSAEESSRFEDLSKVYFEDFYLSPHVIRSGVKSYPQSVLPAESLHLADGVGEKREFSTPTDEDLAELLADVSKEGGQLNRLACSDPHSCPNDFDTFPVVSNVSLSEGIVFTAQNVSEMSVMEEQQRSAIAAISAPSAPVTLYNETTVPSFWMQQAEMAPSDIYPNNGFMTFQNDTEEQVVSTGSQYDHQYDVGFCQEHQDENTADQLQHVFDPYYSTRTTSFSNESLSACSSFSGSTTVSPHTEIDNCKMHKSRYFGKLAPRGVDEMVTYPTRSNNDNGVDDSVATTRRRRGRQSKDEQLAAANRLPLSAREISELSLGELHKVLKNLHLTEHQRQLIRKIRRRGKNKVAARNCRERRGERQRYLHEPDAHWNERTHVPEPPCQIHL
ncbi:hypothetical protein KIN20_026649 [Parelaphostrongylus tenuis]|uniref:BZIP domain-containing protein n=1 Tax=Parelaphostrongylus tenuis TaxID=148309 RepID=A0AAD5WD06_PARTN|nr:hypothetical protein KIN20_026649 [Parelaphostrongylus tenuis]